MAVVEEKKEEEEKTISEYEAFLDNTVNKEDLVLDCIKSHELRLNYRIL